MAKPSKPKAEKVAASIHITDADKMTAKGRREIAKWLRQHADFLLEHGHEYAPKFRGRYIYT